MFLNTFPQFISVKLKTSLVSTSVLTWDPLVNPLVPLLGSLSVSLEVDSGTVTVPFFSLRKITIYNPLSQTFSKTVNPLSFRVLSSSDVVFIGFRFTPMTPMYIQFIRYNVKLIKLKILKIKHTIITRFTKRNRMKKL